MLEFDALKTQKKKTEHPNNIKMIKIALPNPFKRFCQPI